ncbi:hypothetical protein [Xenorhabdus szentirmaii]|nr:hypothetical protein [Xenorhabdus sp. M]
MASRISFVSKTGVGATTGIGGFLSLLCKVVFPDNLVELALMAVPIITPIASLLLINITNSLIDDPASIAMRAKYNRDLKALKKTIDEACFDETKQQAQREYDLTLLLLSRVGRDTIHNTESPEQN